MRPLLRVSLRGFLENELTSAEGNVLETLAYILALLIAGSICVSFLFVIKYYFALGVREWEFREAVSWADKEFLISLSMAVTSFVTVLAWDSLYPGRRDCMILTSLRVRMRSIFLARILSILALLGCCTVAVNSFSTVVFPLMVLSERLSWSAFFAYASAHLISLSAAGCFAFSSLLALQGLLAIVLGYRQFRWISTWVQFGVLLGILCLFFMMPDIAYRETLADANRLRMAMWLPPFWFLGLYQSLLGSGDDSVLALARAARLGLLAAAVAACVMYASGYVRHVRAAMEEAELEPRRASPGGAFIRNWLKRLLLRSPVQAAVFHFVARTMRRNRRHRLLLAISGTVGLAYVFEAVAALVRQDSPGYWLRPTAEAISVPQRTISSMESGTALNFCINVPTGR